MTKNNLISMGNFEKIVQIQKDHFGDNILAKPGDFIDQNSFDNARDLIIDEIPGLIEQFGSNVLKNRIGAILNPETRQYALENFVEKEEYFKFKYNKLDDEEATWMLSKSWGLIVLKPITTVGGAPFFTKRQVEEAGYDLDKFTLIKGD